VKPLSELVTQWAGAALRGSATWTTQWVHPKIWSEHSKLFTYYLHGNGNYIHSARAHPVSPFPYPSLQNFYYVLTCSRRIAYLLIEIFNINDSWISNLDYHCNEAGTLSFAYEKSELWIYLLVQMHHKSHPTFPQKSHTVYFFISVGVPQHLFSSLQVRGISVIPIPMQLSTIYAILFGIKTIALGHVDI